jgi:protein-S-isoprenylcysteine O-methyltransferase Ste14
MSGAEISKGRSRLEAALGSALFLVVAPGVMALLVPWWLTGWQVQGGGPGWWLVRTVGVALCAAGAVVLLQAFARFVVEGLGTPAPIAPTEHLVVGGTYRYVRNPMYLAVTSVIVGQALLLVQPVLLVYGAVFLLVTATFVRLYEEPTLRRQFGAEYDAYRTAVPGWWPSRRPYDTARLLDGE